MTFKHNFPLMDITMDGFKKNQEELMQSLTNEQVWNWHETHRCIGEMLGQPCVICEEYFKRFGPKVDPQAYDAEPVELTEEEAV